MKINHTKVNPVFWFMIFLSVSYCLDGILLKSGNGHIGVLQELTQNEATFVVLNDGDNSIAIYPQKDILAIYSIVGGNMVSVPAKGNEYFSPTKQYLTIKRTETEINSIFLMYHVRGRWLNKNKQLWLEENLRGEYLISSEIEKEQHNESSNVNHISNMLKNHHSE